MNNVNGNGLVNEGEDTSIPASIQARLGATKKVAQTETIGSIPISKFAKPAWNTYKTASKAFADAKTASEEAKAALKETIKDKLVAAKVIPEDQDIDFVVNGELGTANSIRVYKVFNTGEGRAKGKDLSDIF